MAVKVTLEELDFRLLVRGHTLTLEIPIEDRPGQTAPIQICLAEIGFRPMIDIIEEAIDELTHEDEDDFE